MISQNDVGQVFSYADGRLLRKSNGRRGYLRPDGYVYCRLLGKSFSEHRLIFLLFNGYLPAQVDHKNGDRSDNRIENLRPASHAQNCMNRKQMNCTAKGCYWQSRRGKWICQIGFNGKRITVGYFDTLEAASEAYKAKSIELHGEFSRIK